MKRVVHLISEFSGHEAMGRTVTETALRVPGEHHLITTRVHDGGGVFASVTEVGGDISTFPLRDRDTLLATIDAIGPDVVHLHAGALGPLLAWRAGLHRYPLALTVYAWPGIPGVPAWRHAGWSGLRRSNVLPARVAVTAALPPALVRTALRKLEPLGVLSPDPRAIARLRPAGVPVVRLTSGAPTDPRRASFDPPAGADPVIVFAGRAEVVRGVLPLIDAFPAVRAEVPRARLRLLLLPRPDLARITAAARASAAADAIDIVTDPIPDLLAELANAQVGAWPFLADYTTSPPAMAVAEAMAVGLPVVSTPVACVRSVMEPGRDGLAVPPGDVRGLSQGLTRLLTRRDEWSRFSAAGLEAAARMSWDSAARATAEIYDRAPASGNGPRPIREDAAR